MSAFLDWLTAMLVLVGVFLLAYSAIRHKDLSDTLREIKDFVQGKTEEIKNATGGIPYMNR